MDENEAKKQMDHTPTHLEAALVAFKAIRDFSDREMGDGDAARALAEHWLARFEKE